MNAERHRKKLLSDILLAIEEIDLFFDGAKDFQSYKNDLKLRKAVERELKIIGEAMHRLLELAPDIEITDARKVVNLRNRIIHGYDKVVDEVIWGVLSKHLPTLKVQVEQLLKA
ncbi:MAG: DUF86 domain-containing protein [Flavobacteriales bacterium]|nr:DUF86 domain-containing protein [Flavobacteriales bacterium]